MVAHIKPITNICQGTGPHGVPQKPITAGVVKLAFSWMGMDVTGWKGEEQLAEKLVDMMFRNKHASESQIATALTVQEFVPNRVVELRIIAFPVLKNHEEIEEKGLEVDLAAGPDADGGVEWGWDFKVRYMVLYDNENENLTMAGPGTR